MVMFSITSFMAGFSDEVKYSVVKLLKFVFNFSFCFSNTNCLSVSNFLEDFVDPFPIFTGRSLPSNCAKLLFSIFFKSKTALLPCVTNLFVFCVDLLAASTNLLSSRLPLILLILFIKPLSNLTPGFLFFKSSIEISSSEADTFAKISNCFGEYVE